MERWHTIRCNEVEHVVWTDVVYNDGFPGAWKNGESNPDVAAAVSAAYLHMLKVRRGEQSPESLPESGEKVHDFGVVRWRFESARLLPLEERLS